MIQKQTRLVDGRLLSWKECGSGPELVLLHGWAMSSHAFDELGPLLCSDFRLLVPDLPGHGESSPAATPTLTGLVDDLQNWMTAAEVASPSVFGWSLGGMLALELAQRPQLSVDRLVLVGTTPRFTATEDWAHGLPKTQLRAMQRNLQRQFEKTLTEFFQLSFAGEQIAQERLREIRSFAVRSATLPETETAGALLDLLMSQDQRGVLAKIPQETLVLHGDQDRIVPVEAGRALADQIPHAFWKVFEGIGHAPFLSRPGEVAKAVREFL